MENMLGNTLGTWGTYGNPLGTHREHSGNTMGTKEKRGKKESLPAPKLKRKKKV